MTQLRQLRDLKAEAADLARRILEIKREDNPDADALRELSALYSSMRERILTELAQAEREIQGVPDPRLRRVLRLKYLDGLTWTQIAVRVDGRPDTGESIRKAVQRYFRGK